MPKMPKGISRRKDGRYTWRFQYRNQKYQGYAHTVWEAEQGMFLKRLELHQQNGDPGQNLFRISLPAASPAKEDAAVSDSPFLTEQKDVAEPSGAQRQCTVDDLFPEWLDDRRRRCKAITCATYQVNYKNCIQPALGALTLLSLSSDQIMEFLQKLAGEYSRTILKTNITILNGLLQYARKKKLISANPMHDVVLPSKQAPEKRPVLSREEQQAFFAAAGGSPYHDLYMLAAYTGMRLGELLALSWDNIDQDNRLILVRHTLDYTADRGLFLETPKTRTSRREIPLLTRTAALLEHHREEQKRQRAAAGSDWNPPKGMENLVFTTAIGTPIYQASVNYDLQKIQKALAKEGKPVRHFTFHTLRHCFATRCIEEGMNMKTLQAILGHSSMKTTMDVYAHCLPDTMRQELEKVDQRYFSGDEPEEP